MVRHIRSGRARQRGFTIVELMIVLTVIGILRSNLFTIRTMIDEYTYDKQKAPQTLQDLVEAGYLRQVPIDPMTRSADTWKVIMEDALQSTSQSEPGIFDVRSGSDKRSLEGTNYSEW